MVEPPDFRDQAQPLRLHAVLQGGGRVNRRFFPQTEFGQPRQRLAVPEHQPLRSDPRFRRGEKGGRLRRRIRQGGDLRRLPRRGPGAGKAGPNCRITLQRLLDEFAQRLVRDSLDHEVRRRRTRRRSHGARLACLGRRRSLTGGRRRSRPGGSRRSSPSGHRCTRPNGHRRSRPGGSRCSSPTDRRQDGGEQARRMSNHLIPPQKRVPRGRPLPEAAAPTRFSGGSEQQGREQPVARYSGRRGSVAGGRRGFRPAGRERLQPTRNSRRRFDVARRARHDRFRRRLGGLDAATARHHHFAVPAGCRLAGFPHLARIVRRNERHAHARHRSGQEGERQTSRNETESAAHGDHCTHRAGFGESPAAPDQAPAPRDRVRRPVIRAPR